MKLFGKGSSRVVFHNRLWPFLFWHSLVWWAKMKEKDAFTSFISWSLEPTRKWEVTLPSFVLALESCDLLFDHAHPQRAWASPTWTTTGIWTRVGRTLWMALTTRKSLTTLWWDFVCTLKRGVYSSQWVSSEISSSSLKSGPFYFVHCKHLMQLAPQLEECPKLIGVSLTWCYHWPVWKVLEMNDGVHIYLCVCVACYGGDEHQWWDSGQRAEHRGWDPAYRKHCLLRSRQLRSTWGRWL